MAATIEGAFVLIDRASSTMEKMERQAKKTMAAIEGVGAAQDAQTKRGATASRGVEGNTKALKAMEGESRTAKRGVDDLGRSTGRASQRVQDLERKLASLRTELGRMRGAGGSARLTGIAGLKKDVDTIKSGIGDFLGSFGVLGQALMAFKFPAIGAGVGVLVQSLTALGGAAAGALPGIAALASGINLLPGAVSAGLQGLFTMKAAMMGVAQAVQAGMQAQNQWAYNQREYQHQVTQASQAVAEAQHGVTDAIFSQQEAVHGLGNAYYAHRQALQGLSNSMYEQRQAQLDLTTARRDAIRTLQDMEFAANSAVLKEARAGLNIRQAQAELQQTMMTPGASSLQVESARLNLLSAQSDAQQTHTQAVRQRVDYARAAGGDPTAGPVRQIAQAQHALAQSHLGVASAQHQVRESAYGIVTAQHALANASYGVMRAQLGVVNAQYELNKLYREGNSGVSAYMRQLRGLQPIQRQFVRFLVGRMGPGDSRSLLGQLQQMQQSAGQGLFGPLMRGVHTLMGAFPMLDRNMQATGGVLGNFGRRIIEVFFGRRGLKDTNSIMQTNTKVLGHLSGAGVAFAHSLQRIMVVAEPTLIWLSKMIEQWAKLHDRTTQSAQGQDALRHKLERFRIVLTELGRILHNVWNIFKNFNKAAWDFNQVLTGGAIRGTGNLAARIAPGTAGAKRLHDWLMGLLPVLRALARLAEAFGRGLVRLTSPGANRGTAGLINGLGKLVPILATIILNLEKIFGPPIIAAMQALGGAAGALSGQGGVFTLWLKILTDIVKVLGALVKIPIVGRGLLAFFAVLFAARTVTSYASKILGVARSVTTLRDRWREAGAAQRRAMGPGMASPGTTRRGGIFSRAWQTVSGNRDQFAVASEQSHTWGIKSISGPGSEANPLIVRVQGGFGGRGGGGDPFSGGSSTGKLAGEAGKLESEAAKLSRLETAGAYLAGKGRVGGALARGLSHVPGLGGLASDAAKAAGAAGEVGKLGIIGSVAGKLGAFGKVLGPIGLVLSALPALTAFISTKGGLGTKLQAGGNALVSSATFGLLPHVFGASDAFQRAQGSQRGLNTWNQIVRGSGPYHGGSYNQGTGMLTPQQMAEYNGRLRQLTNQAAVAGARNPRTGLWMPDMAVVKDRLAQFKRLQAQMADYQTRIGTQQATNWQSAFGSALQRGTRPKQAMTQMIGGMTTSLVSMGPMGKRTMLSNMEQWAQQMQISGQLPKSQVDQLNQYIVAQFQAMGQSVQVVNGQILTGSAQEWGQISSAMTNPMLVAQEKLAGSFGTIQKMAIGSLRAMGFSGADARNLLKGLTGGGVGGQIASSTVALSQSQGNLGAFGTVLSQASAAANSYTHKAAGGRVAGRNKRDVYQFGNNVLGGGELVMNQHHEMEANARLLRHGEPTVGAIVASRNTPNWAFAGGGRLGSGAQYALPLPRGSMMPGSWSIDQGVDIPAPAHTPEYAIASGTVTGHGASGFGPWAPLLTFDQPIGGHAGAYYGHAGPGGAVPIGTHVNAGQQIGEIGAGIVGKSTGPHIEFGWLPFGPMGNGGSMATFLHQLMGGRTITGIGGSAGALAGSAGAVRQMRALKAPHIRGLGGVPYALAQAGANLFAAGLTRKVNQRLAAMAPQGSGLSGLNGISGGGTAGQNQMLARKMMLAAGWGPNQWPSLQALWTQESGFRTTATNPSSGAYGIPQSLPASKLASAGSDWRSNPATQIKWGLNYIKGRYGSPAGAEAHERAFNWYTGGGRVKDAGWNAQGGTFRTNGPTIFGAGEGGRSEKVTIEPNTPANSSSRPIHVEIHEIVVNRKGDVKKIVDEELDLLAASLRGR